MTYHMLTFLPTQNTLLLGHDDEPADIAAFRTYDNGGFFYYMAFDPGPYSSDPGDFNNWTVPFIQSALDAQVPEPSTLLMMGSSLLGLGIWRRRK